MESSMSDNILQFSWFDGDMEIDVHVIWKSANCWLYYYNPKHAE